MSLEISEFLVCSDVFFVAPNPLLCYHGHKKNPKHYLNAGWWIILKNLPILELKVYTLTVLDY